QLSVQSLHGSDPIQILDLRISGLSSLQVLQFMTFFFLVQDNNFHSHHHNKKSINVFQAVSAAFKNVSASVFYLYIGDILPSLKRMGFLDTNARNPDITIVGITLAFQFGNALPKYITGCKNITVVYRSARRAYPRAVA